MDAATAAHLLQRYLDGEQSPQSLCEDLLWTLLWEDSSWHGLWVAACRHRGLPWPARSLPEGAARAVFRYSSAPRWQRTAAAGTAARAAVEQLLRLCHSRRRRAVRGSGCQGPYNSLQIAEELARYAVEIAAQEPEEAGRLLRLARLATYRGPRAGHPSWQSDDVAGLEASLLSAEAVLGALRGQTEGTAILGLAYERLVADQANPSRHAEWSARAGWVHQADGRYRQAEACLVRAGLEHVLAGNPQAAVATRLRLAQVRRWLGEAAAAEQAAREARALTDLDLHPELATPVYLELAHCQLAAGQPRAALAQLEALHRMRVDLAPDSHAEWLRLRGLAWLARGLALEARESITEAAIAAAATTSLQLGRARLALAQLETSAGANAGLKMAAWQPELPSPLAQRWHALAATRRPDATQLAELDLALERLATFPHVPYVEAREAETE